MEAKNNNPIPMNPNSSPSIEDEDHVVDGALLESVKNGSFQLREVHVNVEAINAFRNHYQNIM